MEDSSVRKREQSQHYHEPTIDTSSNTDVDVTVQVVEINYTDSSQQDQYQPHFMPQQHQQEDYQPPLQQQQQQLPEQPVQRQSQAQQYPTQSQTNQAYGDQQAARPIQFPPPAPGPQPIPFQPEQFPPQNPNQPAAYRPRPAQFPPQNPTQPVAYPPQAPQSSQPQPVQFPPPQPAAYPPQAPQNLPNQPVQYPPRNPQMNPMYSSGPNEPVAYPPQRPQPTLGTYPAHEKPQVYPPRGQAFTQEGAQGYNMRPTPYKPTVEVGIPLRMNQVPQQQNYTEQWKTGLFDCMEDPNNALITAFFPCITFGQIAEIVDNGQTTCDKNGLFYGLIAFCIAMPCLMSCGCRTKLRNKYGLVDAPGPDWAVHCLFEWCALCQEYRELQHRGLDPAIGWQGNVMRQGMQQQRVAMRPPMNQQMMP